MRIVETIVFRGPNCWSLKPTIQLRIDAASTILEQISRFNETIHRYQLLAGLDVCMHPPTNDQHAANYSIAVEFEEESLTRECIRSAAAYLTDHPEGAFQISREEERRIVDLADDLRLGPSSRAILRAATARGIPYYRLNTGSLVQLGEGIHQRRIWTAETDATSAIAESIASDKQLTRSLLASIGVPVPLGREVSDPNDALRAVEEIGYPVAVKPCNANHARGVTLDLKDAEAVLAAYEWARTDGQTDRVLVEQFICGDHHRLLVIGGRMVAAIRGQREYVYGDGEHTIRELVEEVNRDPRRGANYTDLLDLIPLDDAAAIILRQQGLTVDSIPELRRQVLVKQIGDLVEDCTSMVHPQTAAEMVLAARIVGLDIAGMDVVAKDISQPLLSQRGGIVEVNAGPSLTPHVAPLIGDPQPVGEAVIEMLFPQAGQATIPIFVCVGEKLSQRVAEKLFVEAQRRGKIAALSTTDSCFIGASRVPAPADRFAAVQALLMHPDLELAIVACSVTEVSEHGIPALHATQIIVTDGINDQDNTAINTRDQRRTWRTLVQLAQKGSRLVIASGIADRVRPWLEQAMPADSGSRCEALQTLSIDADPTEIYRGLIDPA